MERIEAQKKVARAICSNDSSFNFIDVYNSLNNETDSALEFFMEHL